MAPNGLISGTPDTVSTSNVTVTATDSFGLVGTAIFTWQIVAPPTITASNQSSISNTSVTYTPTATGGTGTLTWTASGLPSGLGISASTGTISGTPTTVAAATNVVLTVTDGQHQQVSKTITWTITAAPTLTITTPAAQISGANVALPTALQVGSSGGLSSYRWSTSNLPPGLTISSSGAISGTPTTPGVYSVTVTVADSSSQTATTSAFTWTVWGITSPPTSLESAVSAAIIPVTPTLAFAPTGTVTWTIAGNPSWMAISSSTGVVSGTAPSGNHSYNITLTATVGGKATALNVAWVFTSSAIVTGPNANQFSAVGNAIASITVTSANFSGTPTWSDNSTLPPGITITSGGVISGTPTTAGVYTVTITATKTGNNAATDTQTFTWIVEALSITAPTGNRTNTHGTTITPVPSTATGGAGTLTWAATGLPNPNTLTINSSTGTISGTLGATKQVYNTTITVTDGYGISDPQSFTWTVN